MRDGFGPCLDSRDWMEWKIWAFDGASEDGTAWIVKEYAAGRGGTGAVFISEGRRLVMGMITLG